MEKNYTFYILVQAKGDNEIHAGPFELHIGCHKDIPILNAGEVVYNKTYPLRTDRDQIKLSFEMTGFKSKNTFCSIINFELLKNKPDLNNLVRPFDQPKDVYLHQNCTAPPCNKIEFT